ncbi:MAG TPA: hypothetical protein VNM90_09750, partial [Haliangium sp.]|nr:hypothetical protein [Haliangium sp.]
GASKEAAESIPTMLTGAAEVTSLNGADLDKPVRAVVLDPKKHPKPVVLLFSVSNADELATAVGKERLVVRKDLGLVGAPEAVKVAHDYAFGTLARRDAPAAPRGTLFMQPILTSFRPEIEAAKTQIGALMAMAAPGGNSNDTMTKLLTLYIEGALAVAEQVDRVEMHFASQDALSGVELVVHARPDTTLAGFSKAQAPSDLALIEMLPAHEAPIMIMAGGLSMGPARQAFQDTGNAFLAAMWGSATSAEMGDWFGPFMDLFTGRFAAAVTSMGTGTSMGMAPQMVQLIEAKDSAQAASVTRTMMETLAAKGTPLEMMGIKQTITFTPEAFAHDGVTVMMQQTRTEVAAPPQDPADGEAAEAEQPAQPGASFESKSYFAGVDGFFGMAMGEEQNMRQLIDAVRSKAPRLQVGGALGQARAAATARKDSALMFMNLGALFGGAADMPQAVVFTFGFDDTRMRMFLAAGR